MHIRDTGGFQPSCQAAGWLVGSRRGFLLSLPEAGRVLTSFWRLPKPLDQEAGRLPVRPTSVKSTFWTWSRPLRLPKAPTSQGREPRPNSDISLQPSQAGEDTLKQNQALRALKLS